MGGWEWAAREYYNYYIKKKLNLFAKMDFFTSCQCLKNTPAYHSSRYVFLASCLVFPDLALFTVCITCQLFPVKIELMLK